MNTGWHKSDENIKCRLCTSQWKDGIDLTKDSWPAAIRPAYIKNANEITTFDNDQETPDWKSTARSGEDVALDHTKLDELLNGLTSSLTSRGAWCTAENGAMLTMSNDWKVFKEGIVRFVFDPRQPDHESKFLVVWWKKGGSTMMIGCAHCMRSYNIDLPSLTAASQKLISNKSKKDWAGFKTIIYMCRDQKAT